MMKKLYCKPLVLIENFLLASHIAGDCEVKTGLPSNDTCGIEQEGVGVVFLSSMNGCSWKVGTDDGNYNEICYHVPTGENLFNS